MTTPEETHEYIHRYIQEVGLTKEQTFKPETNAWYWNKGSALIEVFIQKVEVRPDWTRHYLRLFSKLAEVPIENQVEFLRKCMEINDTSLGVKLTIAPGTNKVFATYERDIQGIDYLETATCIADFEWWADQLDDQLKSFGKGEGNDAGSR